MLHHSHSSPITVTKLPLHLVQLSQHRIQYAVGDMTMSGWKPTISLIHPPTSLASHHLHKGLPSTDHFLQHDISPMIKDNYWWRSFLRKFRSKTCKIIAFDPPFQIRFLPANILRKESKNSSRWTEALDSLGAPLILNTECTKHIA